MYCRNMRFVVAILTFAYVQSADVIVPVLLRDRCVNPTIKVLCPTVEFPFCPVDAINCNIHPDLCNATKSPVRKICCNTGCDSRAGAICQDPVVVVRCCRVPALIRFCNGQVDPKLCSCDSECGEGMKCCGTDCGGTKCTPYVQLDCSTIDCSQAVFVL